MIDTVAPSSELQLCNSTRHSGLCTPYHFLKEFSILHHIRSEYCLSVALDNLWLLGQKVYPILKNKEQLAI